MCAIALGLFCGGTWFGIWAERNDVQALERGYKQVPIKDGLYKVWYIQASNDPYTHELTYWMVAEGMSAPEVFTGHVKLYILPRKALEIQTLGDKTAGLLPMVLNMTNGFGKLSYYPELHPEFSHNHL
jgi:hypothetical protein